ncbi:O-antigen ligase family protein [Winogradskyella ouciana]|nr:O-antigen ligase family protein [Winogradskyella ouciana]
MIVAKLRKGLFASFLVLVATKSIVDAFWDYKLGVLSLMSVQGILLPFLFYPLFSKFNYLPKYWARYAKTYIFALSVGLIWVIAVEPLAFVETLFLNANIFLGFLLMPLLINSKKRLKKMLIAMMVCGIFPILVSIYQLQTGIVFRERETVGLIRYVGFYHDAFPVRFYGLTTLLSILIYQSVFKVRKIYFKLFLIALAGSAFISIYVVFSKAAVGILGLWIVLLLLFSNSRIKQGFSILIGILVIILVFGDVVSDNIEQLFSKEVGYQKGEVKDARYTLAGRGYLWQKYWRFFANEQSSFFQWLGDGVSRPTHNEFIRVLLMNGIIGLLALCVFLIKSLIKTFKIHKTLRVYALMLFGMYFIDSIGLVPGSYYYYNILVWGIFGLLLLRPQLFINHNTI